METTRQIEIWFFIGSLLCVYGLLIFGAGIYHFINQSPPYIVLSELHADIWWGALLIVIGLFYTIRFWPSRQVIPESKP